MLILGLAASYGCQPQQPATASLPRLDEDSHKSLLPQNGAEFSFTVTTTTQSEKGEKVVTEAVEKWQWQTGKRSITLVRVPENGPKRTEAYNTEPAVCLSHINNSKVEPCLPVILSRQQVNPYGGFKGARLDGTTGDFASVGDYLGPEEIVIDGKLLLCHVMSAAQTFEGRSEKVTLEKKTWWSQGRGIVKATENWNSKGLNRETISVIRPK